MLKRRGQKGFTLIELLIVVAIIGIIAAILIPNLLDALQKAKQKRTVSDIRNTGTAWMSWLTDQVGAASAGSAKTYNATGHGEVDYDELFGYLHPSATFFYMQEVPQLDGWRYAMAYAKAANLLDSNVLIICAGGRDGSMTDAACKANWTVAPFVATDYDQDIVWADGYFVSWPGQVN
jgi:prepilin-type N-terminal cleavage/methylation domain-containing protein